MYPYILTNISIDSEIIESAKISTIRKYSKYINFTR